MKYIISLILFGITLSLSALPRTETGTEVPAPREAASLVQLDEAVAELARSIQLQLLSLPSDSRVSVGPFYLNDADTGLGSYWTGALAGALAGTLRITMGPDRGDLPAAAYILQGGLLEAGDIVRVYTQLVETGDRTLVHVWNTDFVRSPFIETLIQTVTGSSTVRRDRYEPDSKSSPVAAAIGGPELARSIHDRTDHDWFRLSPDKTGLLVLETSGSLDTYMKLYDGDSGAQLKSNDDGGQRGNARIEWSAEAGRTYIAEVYGLNGSDIGQYGFMASFEEEPVDTNEPNDTQNEAALIAGTGQTEAAFGGPGDIDWYKVTIGAEGGQLAVLTESRMDTKIALYKDREIVQEDDDSASGENAGLTVILSEGDYYIKVQEADGRQGRYTLRTTLRPAPVPDSFENDNNRSGAKDIRIGEAQERTFSNSHDVDWVRLVITEGGYLELRIAAHDDELDSYMELYNTDFDSIATDDDSGGDFNARIRTRLDAGTYYLKISCLDNDPLADNRYTLRVSTRLE
ncbi:hypothetical protein ACYULU_00110 [Breznakiellaceae bacterium SP9]